MNHCINSSTSSEPKPNPILASAISLSYFCWRVAIGWRSNTIIRYFQLLPTFDNLTVLIRDYELARFLTAQMVNETVINDHQMNKQFIRLVHHIFGFVNPINSAFPNFMPSAPSIFRFDLVYSSFGFRNLVRILSDRIKGTRIQPQKVSFHRNFLSHHLTAVWEN